MQSKATEPIPRARKILPNFVEPLAAGLPGAVQHQEARRGLSRQDVTDEGVAVERNVEAARHVVPHKASRSPEERERRREIAAARTAALPQTSTRRRARVRPV